MLSHTKQPAVWFIYFLCGLGIFRSSLTVIEAYAFHSCYQNVRDLTSIFCQRQGIKNLSAIHDLPNDTKALNLSSNYISDLPHNAFHSVPILEHLRLDLNHISSINATAFLGLTSLLQLNLSFNFLSKFPFRAAESLTSLTHLYLHQNLLTALCGQGFLHSLSLQVLDISLNQLDCETMSCSAELPSLTTLRARNIGKKCPLSFISLPLNLSELDLSQNNLTKFPNSTSSGLIHVQAVDLAGNRISSPKALANLSPNFLDIRNNSINVTQLLLDLSWAPNLQGISMTLSGPTTLIKSICVALARRSATSLKLTKISISKIEGDFQNCASLQHLDVSGNKIKTPSLFSCVKPLPALISLLMDYSHILSLQFCTNHRANVSLPNLKRLSLNDNHIYRIPAMSFMGMPRLQNLSLAGNRIAYIEKMAFFGLWNLYGLELSENAISVLYNVTFLDLQNLTVLKLRNNRLKQIYAGIFSLPSLLKLDLGGNAIEFIQDNSFKALPKLEDLYLDRNKLRNMSRGIFLDLRQLKVLDLESNNLRFFAGEEPPFTDLTSLRSLKLRRQQPHGIRTLPEDVFTGLGKLKELDLSSNKLYDMNNLPLIKLANLTRLIMSDMCNGMAHMPNTTFSSLSKLTSLILENFGLTQFNREYFQIPELKVLVLTNNMIQTIPEDFDQFLPQLNFLDVRYNPLVCTCANEGFRIRALLSRVHVILFYRIKCPTIPANDNKTHLLADGRNDVCTADHIALIVFSVSIAVVLATLVGGLGYGKGKWYFLYAYYMLRIWLREAQLRKARPKSYRYDAFVSYSSHDEEWVLSELVPNLEAPSDEGVEGCDSRTRGCQLCLHHRDFEPGKTIVSNIVEAIYSSRKTLCLVSPQFFSSEWCCMEVQVALYRLFDESNDLLVLVFLEPPPPWALSTFHKLHRVVRRRTYLEWPQEPSQQKVFWAQLRLALQLPDRKEPEDPGLI